MDFSSLKSVMNKNGQNVQKMEGTNGQSSPEIEQKYYQIEAGKSLTEKSAYS